MANSALSQRKLWISGIEKSTNNFSEIKTFLAREGIDFGRFKLNELAQQYAIPQSLSDNERIALINSFPKLKEKYEKQPGYRADVVCLYPEFEHLSFIMNLFGNVHYHFENEFWYFFDGRLGFTFYSINGFKFSVIVEAGEYIQVPESVWQQCFFVDPKDRMKSMRFFSTSNTVKLPEVIFDESYECG